jgi:hypothetical protein
VKKHYLIILIIFLLVAGTYLGIWFIFLRTDDVKPADAKPAPSLDLRPSIIAKLQQLVKEGSGGLYRLVVEQVEPDVSSSSLEIINGALVPDTLLLKKLEKLNTSPADVFKVSFSSLLISGIGIDDLLSKDRLSLRQVHVRSPVVEVWHKRPPGNRDSATLYQRLIKSMKSIAVDEVVVDDADLIIHDQASRQTNRFNDVSVNMNDVLLDSSTQHDRKGFLFAKQATLAIKQFSMRTTDSLYTVQFAAINLSATEDKLSASGISIRPRLSRQQFRERHSQRKEMYELFIQRLSLLQVDWWSLANEGKLLAEKAVIDGAACKVFLDRSLPFRDIRPDNFPQQLLMRLPVAVSIATVQLNGSDLSYSEYNPGMNKTGTIYISSMKGQLTNVTNIREQISRKKILAINASGLFMHRVPMSMGFQFDLSKYKTGDFSMSLDIGKADSSVLNPVTAPLGEFMIKKGQIEKGTARVWGDNFKTHGKGELRYKDLYLIALKKHDDETGRIEKKTVASKLANAILIKNNNPSGDEEIRRVEPQLERESKLSFFAFVWKTIFLGILKTIGLPASFADKSY